MHDKGGVDILLVGVGLGHLVPSFAAAGIVTLSALAKLDSNEFASLGIGKGDKMKVAMLQQMAKDKCEAERLSNEADDIQQEQQEQKQQELEEQEELEQEEELELELEQEQEQQVQENPVSRRTLMNMHENAPSRRRSRSAARTSIRSSDPNRNEIRPRARSRSNDAEANNGNREARPGRAGIGQHLDRARRRSRSNVRDDDAKSVQSSGSKGDCPTSRPARRRSRSCARAADAASVEASSNNEENHRPGSTDLSGHLNRARRTRSRSNVRDDDARSVQSSGSREGRPSCPESGRSSRRSRSSIRKTNNDDAKSTQSGSAGENRSRSTDQNRPRARSKSNDATNAPRPRARSKSANTREKRVSHHENRPKRLPVATCS